MIFLYPKKFVERNYSMSPEEQKPSIWIKILAGLLILLGLFAGAGSLFLWGQGFLFTFPKDVKLASPMADFFINFPVSILAGLGSGG